MSDTAPITIYVALKDEGVDVWRPVSAVAVGASQFRIGGEVPEHEIWEFQPGQTVECEWRRFADGKTGMVAVRVAV
jgi:hypothetical protein